jgi:hypothetical protein
MKQFVALIILCASALLSGCVYFERGVPQEVVILSFPNEASVYINGEPVGITPMTVDLPRKMTHAIRLEKNGYNKAVKYFSPVANDRSKNFVRVGLSEDLGYYVDLAPGTMKAELPHGLVPESIGADPFARLAQQALEADRQLEAGVITPLEHKAAIEQILSFFEKNV